MASPNQCTISKGPQEATMKTEIEEEVLLAVSALACLPPSPVAAASTSYSNISSNKCSRCGALSGDALRRVLDHSKGVGRR
jgi:hypothetical protein